jgi:hypothetical protein
MPNGRQLASGSSLASRDLKTFSAHGCMETVSPGFSAFEMSPELLPPPIQAPERSGVPSAKCGAGPVTVGGCLKMLPRDWEAGGAALACASSTAAIAASITRHTKIRLITLEFFHRMNGGCNVGVGGVVSQGEILVLGQFENLTRMPKPQNELWNDEQ